MSSISIEAVRKQLEVLGHFDVPDLVIESFLKDSCWEEGQPGRTSRAAQKSGQNVGKENSLPGRQHRVLDKGFPAKPFDVNRSTEGNEGLTQGDRGLAEKQKLLGTRVVGASGAVQATSAEGHQRLSQARSSTDRFLESCARPLSSLGGGGELSFSSRQVEKEQHYASCSNKDGSVRRGGQISGQGACLRQHEDQLSDHRAPGPSIASVRVPFAIVDHNVQSSHVRGAHFDLVPLHDQCNRLAVPCGENSELTRRLETGGGAGPFAVAKKKQGLSSTAAAHVDGPKRRTRVLLVEGDTLQVSQSQQGTCLDPARTTSHHWSVKGEVVPPRLGREASVANTDASSLKPALPAEARGHPKQGSTNKSLQTSSPPLHLRRAKTDRVARYQEMQKAWKKDSFLKASTSKRKAVNFHRHFASQHASHARECAEALSRPPAPTPAARGAPPFAVSTAKPTDPVRLPLSALRRQSTASWY